MIRRHSATMSTSSVCSSVAPASMRESSRRSMTMASKRRTWPTTTSSACCVRSGSSPRRPWMTSAAAAKAVIGERSSWLTSEAKRASRSMRAWTASAMSLNELTSRSRSGSPSRATRVLRSPAAISPAASVIRPSGWTRRRLVHHPDAGGQEDRDRRADDERQQDRAQRVRRRVELERLVVVGVDLGDRDRHADVGLVVQGEPLDAGDPERRRLAEVVREVARRRNGCSWRTACRCAAGRRRTRRARSGSSGRSHRSRRCRSAAGS